MNSENDNAYRVYLTPFFKRIHNKEQSHLRRWTEAREQARQFDERPIDAQVRKVRLHKLLRNIKSSLKRIALRRNQKPRPIRHQPAEFAEIRRIIESRKIGNEFSEQNRYSLGRYLMPRDANTAPTYGGREVLLKRIEYGNACSNHNCQRIQHTVSFRLSQSKTDVNSMSCMSRISRGREYGRYYSARFKLKAKLKRKLYDAECRSLLQECVSFEKDHLDVHGGLEEMLSSNMGLKSALSDIKDRIAKLAAKAPCESEAKKYEEEEDFAADTEYFESFTTIIAKDSNEPEVFIRSYRYTAADDHLQSMISLPKKQKSSLETSSNMVANVLGMASDDLRPKPTTNYAAYKNVVVNFLDNWQMAQSKNANSKKVLSDLFLACSVSLLKDTISENRMDFDLIKQITAKQSESMIKELNIALNNITG